MEDHDLDSFIEDLAILEKTVLITEQWKHYLLATTALTNPNPTFCESFWMELIMTCLAILKPTHKLILLLFQYTGSDGIILFLLNQDQTNLLEDASSMNLVFVYNACWEMLLPPKNWEKLTSSLCPWPATSLTSREFTYLVEIWCGLALFLITELTCIFLYATRLRNQARELELVSKSGSLNLAQLHFDPAPHHLDQALRH